MNAGAIGFLVLLTLCVLAAMIFHWRIRNYMRASWGAALVATIAFQVVGFIHLGRLDAFFLVALVTGGVLGLAVAFIVGVPFLITRRKAENPRARQDDSRAKKEVAPRSRGRRESPLIFA